MQLILACSTVKPLPAAPSGLPSWRLARGSMTIRDACRALQSAILELTL